jgi:hypothetical protein
MKRIALTVVALGFLVGGAVLAQDCPLVAVFASPMLAATAATTGDGFLVEPQDAQIVQCPGSVYATTVDYYSDASRTVLIGSCYTNCQGQQTCTGSQSFHIRFHRSCCTN